MDLYSKTVKELLAVPEVHAIIKKEVPELLLIPMFVIGSKSCGEVFDHIVSKKLASREDAERVMAMLEAVEP